MAEKRIRKKADALFSPKAAKIGLSDAGNQ